MNDELGEPMPIVQLGRTGLYIEPYQAASYLLRGNRQRSPNTEGPAKRLTTRSPRA